MILRLAQDGRSRGIADVLLLPGQTGPSASAGLCGVQGPGGVEIPGGLQGPCGLQGLEGGVEGVLEGGVEGGVEVVLGGDPGGPDQQRTVEIP